MATVQLFATCLGDLSSRKRPRMPSCSCVRPGTTSCSLRVRSAAVSRRSTRGTGRRPDGSRARSCGRSRAGRRSSSRRGRARRWRRATYRSSSAANRSTSGSVGVPGCGRRWGAAAQRGARSPTTTRATCSVSSRLGRAAAVAGRAGPGRFPSPRPDLCCGFGGTFSVRQPEISVAMADDKLAGAAAARRLVTADPGA